MIEFPDSTRVHRKIPKEAFYKHLPLTAKLKTSFVTDVDSIYVEYSLTNESLRLDKKSEAEEILVLLLELKRLALDSKILEAIARQNTHKLVFIVKYEEKLKIAVLYGKLYCTEWMKKEDIKLCASGYSVEQIWEGLISQIAIGDEKANYTDDLRTKLSHKDRIQQLQGMITRTEIAVWREEQPKKRFILYTQLQEYKKQLEDEENG